MQWIPIALSGDLSPGRVMRSVIGADVSLDLAVWRSQSGKVHAWNNRCPHRGMRLSFGFVRGERLSCIYHGWQYGDGGGCQHIPAHPDMVPPQTICAKTYDCAEVDGLIWVAKDNSVKPELDVHGGAPIRSIVINADAKAIVAWFSSLPFPLDESIAADAKFQVVQKTDTCVDVEGTASHMSRKLIGRLQSVNTNKSVLHIQTDPTASPKLKVLLSRWAEKLRWSAENLSIADCEAEWVVQHDQI